ncbi:MAG: hypothetical protein P1R58_11495 [bacterium]|nr:hypothetical protein [bacterium]
MTDFNQPDSPEPNHYTDVSEVPSPLGLLRKCRHLESGDRRALKIIRPDLADKKLFFHWYMAAVSLAGQAAEKLNLPSLIPPLRSAQGTWATLRNREHVVERQYFEGTKEHEARNLNEFVAKYAHHHQGVEDDVALAIMRLIVETLLPMHEAKLASEQGVKLSGIPHLNLKPQNVIIGQDQRTLQLQVKLTDFLVPMAIPLVEGAGIGAPLNYTSPLILTDDSYYGLQADIFSCGLLLYKLVENEDLVPPNLSRNSTVSFIRTELGPRLKNLKLSSARARTREIIIRCITDNENEQYVSIAEFCKDIDRSLKGKDPSTILTDFANRKKKDAVVQKEKKSRKPFPWKPVVGTAVGLALVAGSFFGWQAYKKSADGQQIEQQQGEIQAQLKDFRSVGCVNFEFGDHFGGEAEIAWSDYLQGLRDRALSRQKGILDTLKLASRHCGKYVETNSNLMDFLRRPDEAGEMIELRNELAAKLDSSKIAATSGDFSEAGRYLTDIDRIVQHYSQGATLDWVCDTDAMMEDINRVVDGIGSDCLDEARGYVADARQACEQSDSVSFFRSRRRLENLASDDSCVPEPSGTIAESGPTTETEYPEDETPSDGEPATETASSDCEAKLVSLSGNLEALQETRCFERAQVMYDQAQEACANSNADSFEQLRGQLVALSQSAECLDSDECGEARKLVTSAAENERDLRQRFSSLGLSAENCLDGNPEFSGGREELQLAIERLDSNACSQAIFRATSAISRFDILNQTMGSLESTVRHYRQAKACLQNNPRLASTYSGWLMQAEQYLNSCSFSYAESMLLEIDSVISESMGSLEDCINNVPPVVYTWDSCWVRAQSRLPDAVEVCLQCQDEDVYYKEAMRMAILTAGDLGRFEKDLRGPLQRAFNNSSVDVSLTKENAQAYITMACVYGWDTLGISQIELDSAYYFYEGATAFAGAMRDVSYWWKAWLVAVRRHFARWRVTASPENLHLARGEARDLLQYLNENNVLGSEPYKLELERKIKDMNQKARGGR